MTGASNRELMQAVESLGRAVAAGATIMERPRCPGRPAPCRIIRSGDEWYCVAHQRRWATDEESPCSNHAKA